MLKSLRSSLRPRLHLRSPVPPPDESPAVDGASYTIVVGGIPGAGKSTLVLHFVHGGFVELYDPTIEDTLQKDCVVDGMRTKLEIHDIGHQEDWGWDYPSPNEIRAGDGFLLLYSPMSRYSFDYIAGRYAAVLEIKGGNQGDAFPVVVVSTRSDVADERRQVGQEEGRELAGRLGSLYVDTSAKLGTNVEEPFIVLVREIRRYRKAQQLGVTYRAGHDPEPVQIEEAPKRSKRRIGCVVM